MSSLGLAPGPIERARADLAVIALFAGERPLRGAAGRIDWRLCGRLSHLCAAGRVIGEPGCAVLIPGGGGVRAPRVLGLGLGARHALDAARWERWVDDALARARALRARQVALALPEAGDAQGERLAALAKSIAVTEGGLDILLAPEPGEIALVTEWLRAAARRARPADLEIRAPGEGRDPQGASPGAGAAESSHASAGRSTR